MNAFNDLAEVLPLPEEMNIRLPHWTSVFTSEKWDHLVCWSNPNERTVALNSGGSADETAQMSAYAVSALRHVQCYSGSWVDGDTYRD